MNTTDNKIAEVLGKFGEPMAGNVWRVQGTAVIYHKALERIAAQAKIRFDKPTVIRAERDEAILLVTGYMGDSVSRDADGAHSGGRMEWSIGEALIGVNYRVSGKQAAYVYAMAEKRAKDRVILKLIELHGLVYSEEEADEFKNSAPLSVVSSTSSQASPVELETPKDAFGLPEIDESKSRYLEECKDKIAQPSITEAELRNWWRNEGDRRRSFDMTQEDVNDLLKLMGTRIEKMKSAA